MLSRQERAMKEEEQYIAPNLLLVAGEILKFQIIKANIWSDGRKCFCSKHLQNVSILSVRQA